MKKRNWSLIVVLSLMAGMLYLGPRTAFGADYQGVSVYAYIQSYDKELAHGSVYAYTFREAIQKLGGIGGVDIVFSQDGATSNIYSVNGIPGDFLLGGGWYGFVIREDMILRPEKYLDMNLENGDEIVLYYGSSDKTKIITDLAITEKNGLVTFSVSAAYTVWSQTSENWEKDKVDEKLKDVKIHLIMPGGTRKILKTNEKGIASTTVSKLGMYKYYAESYVTGGIPEVVRTKDSFIFYGVQDENNVTRAEAAAFLVNLFGLTGTRGIELFTDVNRNTKFYTEINTAADAGIISGYEDGSFRPEESVNQLQLAVMLSKVYMGETETNEFNSEDLPSWAITAIKPAVYYNLMADIDNDWFSPVTVQLLQQIYYKV